MTVAGAVMVQDGGVTEGVDKTATSVEPAMTQQAPGHPEAAPTLEFVAPIAGFPDHQHFVLIELEAAGMLFRLQSLEDSGLRFLVVPPVPFFPDYEPEISDDWAQQLDIMDASDALVLLIITTGSAATDATANLLAPIVVNVRTRQAAQVVLEDSMLPLRAPLLAVR